MPNIILCSDSYKYSHWKQYPEDTSTVYSYFESRNGALYNKTTFFGLQYLLKKHLVGQVVTKDKILQAKAIMDSHVPGQFNIEGWEYIYNTYQGRLPVRIKAVPEGRAVDTSNVLMTIENLDPKCFWLTNYLETILTHVWYPSTVASTSLYVKEMLRKYGASEESLPFMLHDFGYRGVSSHESAEIGGLAHLIHFSGTDTVSALTCAVDYYKASDAVGYSVPATEHSVMTALGKDGEREVFDRLLTEYPDGVLSIVGDSYNIYDFVNILVRENSLKIANRQGKIVIRPDSNTTLHPYPENQIMWIIRCLGSIFGFDVKDDKKILPPYIGVIWGDGIGVNDIERIVKYVTDLGWHPDNLAFGMGGGLLQKVNRDTQRFAFKCSARRDNLHRWHDVYKQPLDKSKASKRGRMKLVRKMDESYKTVNLREIGHDELVTVFENGQLMKDYSFNDVRFNATM